MQEQIISFRTARQRKGRSRRASRRSSPCHRRAFVIRSPAAGGYIQAIHSIASRACTSRFLLCVPFLPSYPPHPSSKSSSTPLHPKHSLPSAHSQHLPLMPSPNADQPRKQLIPPADVGEIPQVALVRLVVRVGAVVRVAQGIARAQVGRFEAHFLRSGQRAARRVQETETAESQSTERAAATTHRGARTNPIPCKLILAAHPSTALAMNTPLFLTSTKSATGLSKLGFSKGDLRGTKERVGGVCGP